MSAAASATPEVSDPPRPERGDVAVGVHALEPGDHDDRARGEIGADPVFVDRENAGLGEGAVGQHANLAARVALGLESHRLERDREEADRHLLAGGGDHVELARIGIGRQFPGETEQPIGLAGHRRNDDDELMALAVITGDAARDVADALDAADRRAAVFLDDQCHRILVGFAVARPESRPARAKSARRSDLSECQCRVGAAEAERIGQRRPDGHVARDARHEVEVA